MSLLASDNTLFTGDWTGPGALGVGNFSNGTQVYLQGRMDNVALTGAALTLEELNSRLAAIYVPEPSTFALAALAGLALLVRRMKN